MLKPLNNPLEPALIVLTNRKINFLSNRVALNEGDCVSFVRVMSLLGRSRRPAIFPPFNTLNISPAKISNQNQTEQTACTGSKCLQLISGQKRTCHEKERFVVSLVGVE